MARLQFSHKSSDFFTFPISWIFFSVFLLNYTIVPSIVAKKIGKKLKQIGQNRQIKKVKIYVPIFFKTHRAFSLFTSQKSENSKEFWYKITIQTETICTCSVLYILHVFYERINFCSVLYILHVFYERINFSNSL